MKSGRIFSIEEFSTFDGPGIRTSVFFKGCPLSCCWCHNPESQSFDVQYVKNVNGCVNCGACKRASKNGGELDSNSEQACPLGLVRKCGNDYTSDEVIQRITALAPILNENGGGVTFSGGEPLSRHEFLFECLDGLKGKVHRAVQTCGYCKPEIFQKMLERVDFVLYDIKLVDAKAHEYYCGKSNEIILQNWRALARSKVEFITRVPLIPGVTDTKENLEQIAQLLKSENVREVEVLPYNKLAGAKYASLNRKYEPKFDDSRDCSMDFTPFEKRNIRVRVM